MSSLLACAVAAGAAHAETLRIDGELKQTVGMLREAVSGDVSCYLQLESDAGETFHESAVFELCEDPSLIGQRLKLSYSVESVLAESCRGDVDCGQSDQVVLVTSARVLRPANSAMAVSLCAPDESIAFDCATGTKRVSVCASADASNVSGSLQYRFGKADGSAPPELAVPDHRAVPRLASRGESTPFAGGGGSWLRFHNGAYAYVVYSGIGRWGAAGETLELQGVQVERDGEAIAALPCTGPLQSALGPDWFERMGVISEGEEFTFPSAE
ncbi:hypothetical protein [Aquimonas voraii]|uniref:hypothetical protein n=1 Tax=Aquimonas voraii TaxID=265719 RepID=UPI000B8577BC|nr:hypothetical protein [Aquimonas voraii]